MIDILTPSQDLPGVDLHLRYAERSDDRLTIHLAFYNNSPQDLAQVQGISIQDARLTGVESVQPVEISPSLRSGIVPTGGWLSGGATNGTLSFIVGSDRDYTLLVPGFNEMAFRLDMPLLVAPESERMPAVQFAPGYELQSEADPATSLRIESIDLTSSDLEITMMVRDPQETEPGEATLTAVRRAVVFDARWNQYRSTPGSVALADSEADMTGDALVARFEVPPGGVVLLKVPSFPMLRIPLNEEAVIELATPADLPPSTTPRTLAADIPVESQTQTTRLDDILMSLNRALMQGTREQYLSLFAPALHVEQGRLFDTVRALPLESVVLEARPDVDPEAITEQDAHLDVIWSYRIKGSEATDRLSAEAELGLQHTPERWLITQLRSSGPFWALGPTEAEQEGPFWIFFRPEARPRIDALKTDLQAALQQVEQRLPDRIRAPHVMFVTETTQEFADLTGRAPERFSGLALSRYRIEASGITTTEATFYINGATFQNVSTDGRRQTLVHELTHLLLAPTTMPFTPVWLVEGMAMEVAADLPLTTMRTLIADGSLDTFDLEGFTTQSAFGLHDSGGAQTATDYAYAAYLAHYLVERYGFDQLLAFYDSFADVPIEAVREDLDVGQSEQDLTRTLGALAGKLTPERLEATYGIDLLTLQNDFVAWLRRQGG